MERPARAGAVYRVANTSPTPLVVSVERLPWAARAGGDGVPGDVEVGVDYHGRRIKHSAILYVVIMKSFTMNNTTLKPAEAPRIAPELCRDESGLLYNARMRELFGSLD